MNVDDNVQFNRTCGLQEGDEVDPATKLMAGVPGGYYVTAVEQYELRDGKLVQRIQVDELPGVWLRAWHFGTIHE